jgi:PAS domain S-box-containing protein
LPAVDDRIDQEPAPFSRLPTLVADGEPPAPTTSRSRSGRRAPGPVAFQLMLDGLGVAMYATDARGRITFFNEAAVELWGRRPEIGERWCGSWELLEIDGSPMAHDACPMAVALRERRPVRGGEAIALRPDGSRVRFLAYPTPLFDDRGRMIGAVNTLIDVGDRIRAEEAAHAAARALAASNAVKDEFLGLVSHELRTPVTTIYGNARLLQARGDELHESVKASMIIDMAEEADRLHVIIDNLLHLTRLESGEDLDLEPVVLHRVIERIVRSFRARHRPRDIRIVATPSSALVDGDETYLTVLLENLLSNAVKYSPPDQPIDVMIQIDTEEATVIVADRGMGLGETPAETLFQPFYRSEAARGAAGGLGIGLALCRRIVDALDGQIFARPREGGGAEVGFVLPVQPFTPEPA